MAFRNEAVRGLRQARKAFKDIPVVTKDELNGATNETGEALLERARANLRPGHGVRFGHLRRALGLSRAGRFGVARVGIRRGFDVMIQEGVGKAKLYEPTRVGHLVEFGHGGPHPAPAYPFMIPAAESQRDPYLQRCRDAGRRIEQIMASRRSVPTSGGSLL